MAWDSKGKEQESCSPCVCIVHVKKSCVIDVGGVPGSNEGMKRAVQQHWCWVLGLCSVLSPFRWVLLLCSGSAGESQPSAGSSAAPSCIVH